MKLGVSSDGTATEECMGVMPTKWVVAFDVLAVITHPSNDFATSLTYHQPIRSSPMMTPLITGTRFQAWKMLHMKK